MIFATPLQIKKQEELIKKHCFGDCGKITVAGLDLREFGSSFVCRIDRCLFEEGRIGPVGDLDGEEIMLRKLKRS